MTQDEFEQARMTGGYGVPKQVHFAANSLSATHTHDQVSYVYVVEGTFILNTAKGAERFGPGETCILDRNIEHAEEAGPEGATILVARR
jgi:quercetin dioxygenase-like cupin family protein